MRPWFEVRLRCVRCGTERWEGWQRFRRGRIETRCIRCWEEHGRACSMVIDRVVMHTRRPFVRGGLFTLDRIFEKTGVSG